MIAADTLFPLIVLLAVASPADRGREIYERGTSGGAEIVATMSGTPVAASLVPCGSCHGSDGRGRAEGGVVPSDIRHATLTRPYDVTAPSGRRHGPYDDRSLVRAIAMGVDPAGNRLGEVMPRYQLSRDDAAALLGFLEMLGTRSDPGVSDDAITIGVLGGELPSWDGGEVFGRRIELRDVNDLSEDVFAVIAASATIDLATEADRLGVPVISLLSHAPPPGRHVFHLFGGIEEQRRALSRDAVARKETGERLLVPAPLADPGLFSTDNPRPATVAFAMLPSSRTPRAQASLAAAALIVDALRRAGRDVSRTSFIEALESTSQLRTEHAPPLTFSATRHIGSTGAYLVDFDRGRPSPPRWVD